MRVVGVVVVVVVGDMPDGGRSTVESQGLSLSLSLA
jgi:hypothetical protein